MPSIPSPPRLHCSAPGPLELRLLIPRWRVGLQEGVLPGDKAAAVERFQLNLPVGAVLDATAPGLFFAVAIGRIGCFLTGCCAGRPRSSRWAIWSSDRRVGTRRVPAQLIESGVGLLLGSVALVLAVGLTPPIHGLIFVAASAAYAAACQGLLRLRFEARRSARTLPATAVAAAAVLIAVTAVSLGQRDHMPPAATASIRGTTIAGS